MTCVLVIYFSVTFKSEVFFLYQRILKKIKISRCYYWDCSDFRYVQWRPVADLSYTLMIDARVKEYGPFCDVPT